MILKNLNNIVSMSNYLYCFNDSAPTHWMYTLPVIVQKRNTEIKKLFNCKNISNKKTIYIVDSSECERGRYSPYNIFCSAKKSSDLYHPFIHEETHDIIFREFGMLPCFIFEGLAEYVQRWFCSQKLNDLSFLHNEESKLYTVKYMREKIYWLLNEYDFNKYNDSRNYVWIYTLGENFINFIIEKYSFEFLLKILRVYEKRENRIFDYITDDIIREWIDRIYDYGVKDGYDISTQ